MPKFVRNAWVHVLCSGGMEKETGPIGKDGSAEVTIDVRENGVPHRNKVKAVVQPVGDGNKRIRLWVYVDDDLIYSETFLR